MNLKKIAIFITLSFISNIIPSSQDSKKEKEFGEINFENLCEEQLINIGKWLNLRMQFWPLAASVYETLSDKNSKYKEIILNSNAEHDLKEKMDKEALEIIGKIEKKYSYCLDGRKKFPNMFIKIVSLTKDKSWI